MILKNDTLMLFHSGSAPLGIMIYTGKQQRKIMQGENFIFGIVDISSGILFILLSIPLVAKKIPMNKLYGFRISKSFTSDQNWSKINSYGGTQLILWSIPLIGIGIFYLLFPMAAHPNEIVNVLCAVGPIIVCPAIAVVKTIIFSRGL